ncbi:hypothetical protein CNR22_24245 [Sphingobacteriaceae bacterium]|nr:hypothetical protein CNR22_24245 [Sphingobacteriaceae bacterium]
MLKNKKAVYILIPINILVWGFFGYRIYSAFSETDLAVSDSTLPSVKSITTRDSVTYKLKMDYQDPFLKDVKKEAQLTIQGSYVSSEPRQQKAPAPKPAPIVVPKQLPDIKYLGLIKNTTSGQSTALVSVNGQSKLIKQNEAMDGIVFKSFNKDSLVAKWGKERIVARK